MEKKTLKRIFEFFEEKENHSVPFLWKLINNEPLTDDELNVEGSLNLNYSKITQLPKGLKVGADLYLDYSTIISLPKGLKVGRNLVLSSSSLLKIEYTDDELREMIKPGFIKGGIFS